MTENKKSLKLNVEYSQPLDKKSIGMLVENLSKKDLATLEDELDKLQDELVGLTVEVDGEFKKALKDFIFLEDKSVSYGLSHWRVMKQIIEKVNSAKVEVLEFPLIGALNEIITSTRVSTIKGINVCSRLIDSMFDLNVEMTTRQKTIQYYSNAIVRLTNTEKTGLEYAKEDDENYKELAKSESQK